MKKNSKGKYIEELYEFYEQKMYFYAYRFLKDEKLSEDAVHDTFLKLIEKGKVFGNPGSDECRNYIMTVTKNTIIDKYRKRKREEEHMYLIGEEEELVGGNISGLYDESLDSVDVEEKIDKLPDKYPSVVRCIVIDGMNVRETAEKLEISENAVRKRYERAKKKLRAVLE